MIVVLLTLRLIMNLPIAEKIAYPIHTSYIAGGLGYVTYC